MKINQLPDDGGKKVLQVEADWPDIAADYDDVVAAYSRVQVPGFRPGKVPRSVIEQRLQREILDELAARVARRLGVEALHGSGVEAMGPLEVADIECAKGKPFRFVARFWPLSEIQLPDLGALTVRDDGMDPKDQISDRLLELVRFDVPDDAVRAELANEEAGAAAGSDAWNTAADRVRLMLILKRIARQEGVEVAEADVEQRIRDKALEFGTDYATLVSELDEGGGRQRLRDMLLAESTLDYLVERLHSRKGGGL